MTKLAATISVALALLVGGSCSSRAARTIHDDAYVRHANALCQRELPTLRAQKSQTDLVGQTPKDDRAKTAKTVELVADKLDAVAVELGNLPLRQQDQNEVAAWLEEWANYTGIGRRYASAVRTDRASVYTSIAAEANGPVQRIGRFARANHIDRCVL